MFRKHLTLALAALLAVAPCASAQSGRRQPRESAGRGLRGREVAGSEPSAAREEAAEAEPAADARPTHGADFDLRSLNAGRPSSVVYADDGEKHPNKADKIAGAALLGYLIFVTVVTLAGENYAPSAAGAPAGGLYLRH